MEINELDWAAVEKAMVAVSPGIELGVTATIRIQTFQVDINLCYAKLRTKGGPPWGFCDSSRVPITRQPIRLQKVLWLMLPDLLHAIADEATRLTAEIREATAGLSEVVRVIREREEEEERESMVGLS